MEAIRTYLIQDRGLDSTVLIKYGVGCARFPFPEGQRYVQAMCVTFPWVMSVQDLEQQDRDIGTASGGQQMMSGDGTVMPWVCRRIKARAHGRKEWQRLDPPGGGWGLFGLHTVPQEAKEIVLTEGEVCLTLTLQALKALPSSTRPLLLS